MTKLKTIGLFNFKNFTPHYLIISTCGLITSSFGDPSLISSLLSYLLPQIYVNALNMRLVAAMFVMPHETTKVNYEKVLSFLASSQRSPSAAQVSSPATDAKRQP